MKVAVSLVLLCASAGSAVAMSLSATPGSLMKVSGSASASLSLGNLAAPESYVCVRRPGA